MKNIKVEPKKENLGVCAKAPAGYNIEKCPYQKHGCKMQCQRKQNN